MLVASSCIVMQSILQGLSLSLFSAANDIANCPLHVVYTYGMAKGCHFLRHSHMEQLPLNRIHRDPVCDQL